MYTGPRTAVRQPLPGAAPVPQVAAAGASRRPVPRRPPQPAARRADPADRRGRSQLCRHPGRCRPCRGPQGRWSPRAAPRRSTSRCEYKPVAMSLDIFLPDMLGWNVLSQFKRTLETRHIPVQILQHGRGPPAGPGARRLLLPEQADHDRRSQRRPVKISDYVKPRNKRLLIAEDNEAERFSVTELLSHPDIEIDTAETGHGGAREAAREPLRLHGARPAPARHVGLRGAGADAEGRRRSPTFRSWSSPAATSRPRRTRAPHHGPLDRGQGRGLARAPVRRDRPVPAPGRGRSAGR